MALIESLIASLNPDAGKSHYKYLSIYRENYYIENLEESVVPRLIENSEVNCVEDLIMNEINSISLLKDDWNGMGSKKISSEVLNNSINVIGAIPPSVLYYLKPDNIYPSKYGTIILDWEFGNKDNCLSLEIAKNSIGYFVEVDGNDSKQVEELSTAPENFDTAVASVVNDLAGFLV
jgi:hypothetical protein